MWTFFVNRTSGLGGKLPLGEMAERSEVEEKCGDEGGQAHQRPKQDRALIASDFLGSRAHGEALPDLKKADATSHYQHEPRNHVL